MIEWGALALAVLKLIASIVDDRIATRPQRERAQVGEDYEQAIAHNAQAAAAGDAATLTQQFEAERQAGIRRGDIEPAPIDDRRDRRAAADPRGGAVELHKLN